MSSNVIPFEEKLKIPKIIIMTYEEFCDEETANRIREEFIEKRRKIYSKYL